MTALALISRVDILIKSGMVVDGTGAEAVRTDIGISNGQWIWQDDTPTGANPGCLLRCTG